MEDDPAPEARNDGLDGGAGRFDAPPGDWRVAIAVGKTNEGESFPANLQRLARQQQDIPHFRVACSIVDDSGKLAGHSAVAQVFLNAADEVARFW